MSSILQRLLHAGFTEHDARSRLDLATRAAEAFRVWAGREAVWGWFVPGRIEVFGKHTDYAGGRSLVCAVPRGFAVMAAPRADAVVRVLDAADGRSVVIDVCRATPLSGWANYVSVVVRRLADNFAGAPFGLDAVILSDLPRAAGLSSSSALVVGVATAVIRRAGLGDAPAWRARLSSPYLQAWYLGAVENGRDFPGLPGTAGVGTLGGSEDHTAILTCRAEHLSQNRYAPVVPLGDVAMPADWTFVVANSGIRADKTGDALHRYNRLSRGTEVLLALWNTHAADAEVTLAAALDRAGGPGAFGDLIDRSSDPEFSSDALHRRLIHFVREDARVPRAAAAVAAADREAVTALAADTQREADDLLGNQIAETRALADEALAAGAWAASSFGAGFGGSVWALAPADDALRLGAEWIARYRARCPHVEQVEWFVAPPGPGLLALIDR